MTNCRTNQSAYQCQTVLQNASIPKGLKQRLVTIAKRLTVSPDYAWTDLTYLLHKNNVSWAYYVLNGTEPDCRDDSEITCIQHTQNAKTPGIWNPLPYFDSVKQDGQLGNIFNDLDLNQNPLPPLLLNPHPKTDLSS